MSSIAEWLVALGMAEYTERFAEERIEIDVFSELTDQDLERLGIPLGHRGRMLRAQPAPKKLAYIDAALQKPDMFSNNQVW